MGGDRRRGSRFNTGQDGRGISTGTGMAIVVVVTTVVDVVVAGAAVLIEGGRGRTVGVGSGASVLAIGRSRGTRIDRGRGMALERGMALMALEDAGGEAGGVFVQFGGGTAEFQGRKTALVAHDERWGEESGR